MRYGPICLLCSRALRTCVIIITVAGAGCRTAPRAIDPETNVQIDQQRAQELADLASRTRQDGDTQRARDLLTEAVRLDPGNGQIHHALGLVHYAQGDLYDAAMRLDTAARLLRDRAEPCYNLGLVLESGGQYEPAIRAYERALQRQRDHLESMENLARVRVKSGLWNAETLRLLNACLERETRPDWSDWLGRQAGQLRRRLAPQDAGGPDVTAHK